MINASIIMRTGMIAAMMIASGVSHAAPIDGSCGTALNENSDLLRSVIKIEGGSFFAKYTCSATLISKNILLTAQHCVDQLKPKQSLTLNGDRSFEVVQIISEVSPIRKPLIQGAARDESSDVALLLFKSTKCEQSSLKNIRPIEMATAKTKVGLSNRVLIAGYGITQPDGGDSGVLRAGYNEWLVSDYSEPQLSESRLAVMNAFKGTSIDRDQLMLVDERVMVVGMISEAGKPYSEEVVLITKGQNNVQALPLQGDSGGPAIAFDSNQKPYIVGVASMAASETLPLVDRFSLMNAHGEDLQSFDLRGVPAQSMQKFTNSAMEYFKKKLSESGYIQPDGLAVKDFAVLRVKGRLGAGTYSSVLNSNNEAFLAKALRELTQARDASNYCQ